MAATMAAKIAVALDDNLDGSPADETARSGIGGTGYAIDMGDGGRIPGSIVLRYHAAPGRTVMPTWRITDPTHPRGRSTRRGRKGPRPHMPDE
jgi:hypothetical protein